MPCVRLSFGALYSQTRGSGQQKDCAGDQRGVVIEQVAETRPHSNTYPFHYDFRLHLGGRFVYIETFLQDDDPTLRILSMHDV